MLVGHAHIPALLFKVIYSFHMPLFVLLSGYFFRPKPLAVSMMSDARRLLVPYLSVSLIYLAVVAVRCLLQSKAGPVPGDFTWLYESAMAVLYANIGPSAHAPGIGIIWFLPALFWCKVIYNALAQKITHQVMLPLVVFLALSAIGLVRMEVILPFNFLAGVSLLLFYAIGVAFRSYVDRGLFTEGWLSKQPRWIWLVVLIGLWVASLLVKEPLVIGACSYPSLIVQVTGASAVTLLVVLGMRPLHGARFALQWCGEHSMDILCINFLISMTGLVWLLPFPLTGTLVFLINTFCTLALTWCWCAGSALLSKFQTH